MSHPPHAVSESAPPNLHLLHPGRSRAGPGQSMRPGRLTFVTVNAPAEAESPPPSTPDAAAAAPCGAPPPAPGRVIRRLLCSRYLTKLAGARHPPHGLPTAGPPGPAQLCGLGPAGPAAAELRRRARARDAHGRGLRAEGLAPRPRPRPRHRDSSAPHIAGRACGDGGRGDVR